MSVAVEGAEEPVNKESPANDDENVIEVDKDAISLDLTRTRLMKIEGFEFLRRVSFLAS
ncbi:hypothetical protein OESDEN_14742, partial [Oesophagostomum dentatum]